MRNSRLLILVVVMLMAICVAAGCETEEASPGLPSGNGEANGDDGTINGEANGETNDEEGTVEDDAAAGDENEIALLPAEEGWVEFGDFVRLVESARWSGVSPTCYDGTSVTKYDYEGTEIVNGVTTDKITGSFTAEGDTVCWIIWVAGDGTIVKAEMDGEQADEFFYGLLALMAVPPLAPFALDDPEFNSEFKRTLAGENVPGWNLLGFDRKTENVGGKSAYVCEVSFIHAGWGDQTATYIYGDFDAFKLILEAKMADYLTSFKTESITFR